LIKKSGNDLLYTVPYHPETNPIEEFFSQLKHYIRKQSPQNYKEINDNIIKILSDPHSTLNSNSNYSIKTELFVEEISSSEYWNQ
jgi:transposase